MSHYWGKTLLCFLTDAPQFMRFSSLNDGNRKYLQPSPHSFLFSFVLSLTIFASLYSRIHLLPVQSWLSPDLVWSLWYWSVFPEFLLSPSSQQSQHCCTKEGIAISTCSLPSFQFSVFISLSFLKTHIINSPRQAHSSVALTIFTRLCNYHRDLIPEHFHYPPENPPTQ